MTPIANPTVLIAGGSTALIAAAGLMVVADRRSRATANRISSVAPGRATEITPTPTSRRTQRKTGGSVSPLARVLSLACIAIDRPDLYPIPWWAILAAVALFTSLFVSGLDFLVGSLSWLTFPVAMFVFTRFAFTYFRSRRTTQLYTQLPDTLTMITRSVRGGFTVQDAMRVVGEEGQAPTTVEFRRLLDEIRLGITLPAALAKLADRSRLLEYRFLAVAVALQTQSGGNLSEILENLADVVRKRVALRQRGIALSSEARTTMYILGFLPFFLIGALLVITPDYLDPMLATSSGKKLLLLGITLFSLGFGSMKYIIKKSVS